MSMLMLLTALSQPGASAGQPAPPEAASSSDSAAIRALIDDQIAAFRRHDAERAWRHESPGLRDRFQTPERFLRMVREGYRPVYAPRRVGFAELVLLPTGELGQWLDLTGPDGERVRALYLLERQPDGSWRTSGCLLFEPEQAVPVV
jgi:hypothetical protein